MYDKALMDAGIYGIKDTDIDKIVYVGSTTTSFAMRWGQHIEDSKRGKHCNKELSELIMSKNFEFVILEVCNSRKEKLLELEKHYINLYNVFNDGYNQYEVGALKENRNNSKPFESTGNVILARNYITKHWCNKKIDKQCKTAIEIYMGGRFNITSARFKDLVSKLGFDIQTTKDRRFYYING